MSEALTESIKDFALRELGLTVLGIVRAAPLDRDRRLDRWLATGAHGDMSFMEETAKIRCDPRNLLAGAASVICVGISYHDDHEPPELTPRSDRVVIARYARRRDYHKVMRRLLVRLGQHLQLLSPGSSFRPAVDTAPTLERELAWRAGLGWLGKNTCLINSVHGSELLLGELITDAKLVEDEPAHDHCGSCTACIDACPTGALAAPGFLDARLCTSYLTIEHRGEIASSLHASMGSHLAGCDICQAVCPWNRRAPASCSSLLSLRPSLQALPLRELVGMAGSEWSVVAAGTPLRRLDPHRFRRNLAIVAANARRHASQPPQE